MLYHRLVEEHLKENRKILFDDRYALDYQQIHEKTAQYCAFFQNKQIKKGERILVLGIESLEMVFILLACIAKGYIFVPVSKDTDIVDLEEIIADCQPVLILTDAPRLDGKKNFLENRELYSIDTYVYIIYTSGTSGVQKGVVASQKQILFCCEGINQRLKNAKNDRILCCLPLTFDYGLYQVFLAFLSGACLYLDSGEVLQRIPYLLKKWDITAFPTIPSVANLLLKTGMLGMAKYPKLRYITFTGEVLPVSLIKDLKKVCSETKIVPMYGLTECKRVSVMPDDRWDKIEAGSCGLPLDGVRVYLEHMDPITEIGELVVEGDNVMEGYWNASDELEGFFSFNERTGKKVLHTGDLFRIDSEGFLYFTGRKNGIIKVLGHRFSSVWIEKKLRNIEEIIEIAVSGRRDSLTGEKVVVFIYTERNDMKEQVKNQMKELPACLQNYDLYILRKPLPKNQNGKISIRKIWGLIEENKL